MHEVSHSKGDEQGILGIPCAAGGGRGMMTRFEFLCVVEHTRLVVFGTCCPA